MYSKEEAEGKRLRNPFDTITEGIGINRLTQNFMMARLDGAFRGTDKEAVEMSRLAHAFTPFVVFSSRSVEKEPVLSTAVAYLHENTMKHINVPKCFL